MTTQNSSQDENNQTADQKINILADINENLNYVSFHNNENFINSIYITSNTHIDAPTVEIAFASDIAEIYTENITELQASESYVIENPKIVFKPLVLSSYTDSFKDVIYITVKDASGNELTKYSKNIEIQAHDFWNISKTEMLASFVTPNSPVLSNLLTLAETKLKKINPSLSFNAYQSNNINYVNQQFSAIYQAVQDQHIRYQVASASAHIRGGQRIRSCESILHDKTGNCLDLSCLLASLLENVGLHPLLVLFDDHAYVGVWTCADPYPNSLIEDRETVLKHSAINIHDIILAESTMLCSSESFDTAVNEADKNLKIKNFELALDIYRSRLNGYKPLPQKVQKDNGSIELVQDSKFTQIVKPQNLDPLEIRISENNQGKMTHLQIWKNKLLDLSLRNRLLNLRFDKGACQILISTLAEFEDNISQGKKYTLNTLPEAAVTEYENNNGTLTDNLENLVREDEKTCNLHVPISDEDSLTKTLQKIYRESQTSMEENGANSFFLTMGLLKWYESDTSSNPKYAPILMIPVDISRKNSRSPFELSGRDEETIINHTLLEMLRQSFEIEIPGLDDLPKDENGVDVKKILAIFRKSIMQMPRWDVEEKAGIGNFSFRKFVMWQDLVANEEYFRRNELFNALCNGTVTGEKFSAPENMGKPVDERFNYGELCQPIMADTSQLDALWQASSGRSFVLQGPPGTGKSQTITNIIADALSKRKKVLFVAEKMAALSVVFRRLSKLGLAPYCLELHSNTQRKSVVLNRLAESIPDIPKSNINDFSLLCKTLNGQKNEIKEEISALHEKKCANLSVYDAMCISAKAADVPALDVDENFLKNTTAEILQQVNTALRELALLTQNNDDLSDNPLHLSHLCKVPNGAPDISTEDMVTAGTKAGEAEDRAESILGIPKNTLSIFETATAAGRINKLIQTPDISTEMLSSANLSVLSSDIGDTVKKFRRKKELAAILGKNADDVLSVDVHGLIKEWELDEQKFFIGRFLSHRNSVSVLQKALGADIKITSDNFLETAQKAEKYSEICKAADISLSALSSSCPKLASLFSTDSERACTYAENTLKVAEEIKNIEKDIDGIPVLSNITSALNHAENSPDSVIAGINEISLALDAMVATVHKITGYFSVNENDLPTNINDVTNISCGLLENRNNIGEWTELNSRLEKIAAAGFGQLSESIRHGKIKSSVGDHYADLVLAKTICNYYLNHDSSLAGFRGILFTDKMTQLGENSSKFRDGCKNTLLTAMQHYRRTAENDETLNQERTFLTKAIKNHGRKQSIRSIFDNIEHLLPKLCPCMLMSPLSVAQYLSPDKYEFDLIIFDEASQLPTSEAVGAIARGHQLIVVGDPKQMPPTDFFSAKQTDVPDELEDLESVLDDCMALGMPVTTLNWHYRSTHESLIAFSNIMYYENRLCTFPSPDDQQSKITYIEVNGLYDRGGSGRNKEESKQTIEYLENFLSNDENLNTSIGLLTFNSRQQAQLEDDLEKLYRRRPELEDRALKLPEPIFIKNLENVQGDERDIIVFSIGFGKDSGGRITMNFGPLNRAGGERRLNVAITRAKKEMVVFSSLDPDSMHLTNLSSEGVRGLKSFLTYAKKGYRYLPNRNTMHSFKNDRLIEVLAARLREHGYESTPSLGTSSFKIDLAIKDPKNPARYIACIMSDGYGFSADYAVADKCCGQPSVLAGLGWKIIRIWSCEWYRNPETVLQQVLKQLEDIPESRSC